MCEDSTVEREIIPPSRELTAALRTCVGAERLRTRLSLHLAFVCDRPSPTPSSSPRGVDARCYDPNHSTMKWIASFKALSFSSTPDVSLWRMSPLLEDRCVVVGIASSALFDLEESDKLFQTEGLAAYEHYQDQHVDDTLRVGVAYPFISRLLSFNDVKPNSVEVIILSKNSPRTGMRVMRSVKEHGLDITRSVFRSGLSPYAFMPIFNMSLFLSANEQDVKNAVTKGLPAGRVLPFSETRADAGNDLRIAFDFDGVLADDSAERVYEEAKQANPEGALFSYQSHEEAQASVPIGAGPLKNLLAGLNKLQEAERSAPGFRDGGTTRLRVSLVTARNAPAHERALQTLESWGLTVDDAFFLGGLDKVPILNELKPHIFFDDQLRNLSSDYERLVPAVHIPFGIANRT